MSRSSTVDLGALLPGVAPLAKPKMMSNQVCVSTLLLMALKASTKASSSSYLYMQALNQQVHLVPPRLFSYEVQFLNHLLFQFQMLAMPKSSVVTASSGLSQLQGGRSGQK
ncbi:uncharacterized protein LOC125518698 [Triticum urartu]|uniref:Uncharacterized protein n=1 Tax=Triticum urartu TaxID=4572 RepID=A0A8R7V9S9_TRIUA|nr:uncharacterized protein LOC125518698 [Triticum urartu]